MKNKRNKKKVIALVCMSLNGMAGGIERQIIRTCFELKQFGFDIILISFF